MTTIGFYKIPGNAEDALRFACRLTEKAFKQQLSIHIQTASAEQTQALDELLWSFSATAFLPHGLTPDNPITIGEGDDQSQHHGLLINLTDEIPHWFSRFDRAAEIVYDDHVVIARKREHFKFYKDRGYPIQYHDLGKSSDASEQE